MKILDSFSVGIMSNTHFNILEFRIDFLKTKNDRRNCNVYKLCFVLLLICFLLPTTINNLNMYFSTLQWKAVLLIK